MSVVVLGHWGPPMIMFPTSGGDEEEYERQSMIGAIADFIDAGRVKAFCVDVNHRDSFGNGGAHPFQTWSDRRIYDTERFNQVAHEYGYLAKQFTVFGQHIHVGCASGDDAVYLTHMLSR